MVKSPVEKRTIGLLPSPECRNQGREERWEHAGLKERVKEVVCGHLTSAVSRKTEAKRSTV